MAGYRDSGWWFPAGSGGGGGGGTGAVTNIPVPPFLNYQAAVSLTNSGSTVTASGFSIGPAYSTRMVIGMCWIYTGAGSASVTSAVMGTGGSISATFVLLGRDSVNGMDFYVFYATVPTGTTMDFTATLNTTSFGASILQVYTVDTNRLSSTTPVTAFISQPSGATQTYTANTKPESSIISMMTGFAVTPNYTNNVVPVTPNDYKMIMEYEDNGRTHMAMPIGGSFTPASFSANSASGGTMTQALALWNGTTTSSTYIGPGDIHGGDCWAWYGLRGYCKAYAASGNLPAVLLVDQAGAHPITINVKTDGTLDVAAISSWVSTNSVTTIKVQQWYDQSGHGRHISQATLARMPTLTLSAIGSLPGLTFSTSALESGHFGNLYNIQSTPPFSVSMVSKWTGSGVGIVLFDENNNDQVRFNSSTSLTMNNDLAGTVPSAGHESVQMMFAGTNPKMRINGTNYTQGTLSNMFLFSGQTIVGATDNSGSNPFAGNLYEIGLWQGDKSINHSIMETNQRNYWGF